MELVPIKPPVTSALYADNAVLRVDRSESLLLSLAWRKSSAGFRVIMTTTERMETMARVTRSSIKVKDFLDFSMLNCWKLPARP